MAVQFGRAKHNEKIKIQDCMRYPIWVSAHDERHDEEWQKPIKNKSDVDGEVLRIDNPIITIRVDGQETYGCGYYDGSKGILYAIALWMDEEWVIIEHAEGIEFPLTLVAVPTIKGESNVRFSLTGPGEHATRVR